MRAVRIHEHGGPEVLTLENLPEPKAGPMEVVIQVFATGLNHLDLFVRRGMAGMKLPLPMILGSDIAGKVVEVGAGVEEDWLGKRVLVNPGYSCGRCLYCYEGEMSLCAQYGILGETKDGGYCEFVALPLSQVHPIPEGKSFVEAAAFPLVFLTAWRMLVKRGQIRPGETVLILGGGAGVGTAAIQIAQLLGAQVIATAGSEAKIAKLKELFSIPVLNHTEQPDFHKEIRRLTEGRGVDVVVDYIGEATWVKSLKSLRIGGRLLTCGATTGPHPKTDLRHIFFRQLSVIGSTMGNNGDLAESLRAWEAGKVRPIVDRTLPLEEARKAHELLEGRQVFGKLVLTVREGE